ncbi:extracellular solute-binding protein [Streptomyces sp. N2-109]|uniref:Extracellular solute-binding protein n=1 Tax=Streptomyces gossypii TaxID=2883101 RepID=A0ABT2JUD1_9ACTN|nr:extracellular solute-binding protein [Streptomyces gossypii]MCT2591487.1 extracellular solute-binding protein [Streptomyces gossypii]
MLTRYSARRTRRAHRTSRRLLALAVATALLSGCGGISDADDETRTLDVWLMKGSLTDSFTNSFVQDFETRNPGVQVEITVQEWPGINKKVSKALKSGDGPDVIEAGNTQLAEYVDSGGVRNFTTSVIDLDGDNWIPGLKESGQIDGYQFGIPFYAANRVVIYRTDMFEEAGITSPPKNRAEWLKDTAELDAAEGRQGIYLPGQNWYVLAGFVWDEGGELATELSGQWTGSLDTPAARRGMEFFEKLHALSDARSDADESKPNELDVFAKGDIAQLIATPGSAKLITDANPTLQGKLGFFPVPGKKSGEPGAVFTGGSVLIMPEKSDRKDEGYEFVKLLTGDAWQKRLAQTMSYVPNKSTLAGALKDEPGAAAMAEAAANGHATPASPHWGNLEADNPVKEFQTAVLNGADPKEAARTATDKITRLLSGSPR